MTLIRYAQFRVESEDVPGALEVLTLGHSYFYEENEDYQFDYNDDYKKLYDELNQK